MAPNISILAMHLVLLVLAAVDAKPPAEDAKPTHGGAYVASDEIPEGLLEIDNHGRITVPEGNSLPPHPAVGSGHNAPPSDYSDGGNVPVHYNHKTRAPYPSPVSAQQHTGYLSKPKRRIEDTQVDCLKTHMLVTFKFSVPFHGYIYPHGNFDKCLLFGGHNSWKAELVLKHGTCGDQENTVIYHGRTYTDPTIDHRLVIQWDRDIIGEDDSSVIVRCERPDDYNKTVEWNLGLQDLQSSFQTNTHPGPKMWMEIQRGEGPQAPPLDDESVYVGDVLTLVFTLSDNVYWFDSNILTCFAVDGGEKKSRIEWDTSEHKDVSAAARVFSGETTVIENGCSVKPKIFSHFFKEKHNSPNGDMVTLHYAHFKAFRFPTSMKIVIQCDVQVCYKACEEMPPCSEAFTPRVSLEERRRRRRAAEDTASAKTEGAVELDRVNLYRSIDVYMPDESGAESIRLVAPLNQTPNACYTASEFFGTVLGLMAIILILIMMLMFVYLKVKITPPSFFSPNKTKG
ncbi:uncharacterized protein LOC125045109 [Penaeus chinensis]|uniref:uncharacterized protein LOC125045109 n=1 Tax=Penaeus chinensis TaxID=139456 RepID=UPI001FB75C9B|nr:uncharacterized protein LOC125045109 [Penaeus chinensis]